MRPWLLVLAFPLLAAAPARKQFSLVAPGDDGTLAGVPATSLGKPIRGPIYEPAPVPNREFSAPQALGAGDEPSLAPTLFTSKNQYRGDGFSPGSTAQSEQEKRAKPGAGFSLHMPLTPQ